MKRTLYLVLVALGAFGLMAGVATAKTKKVKTNVSFQMVGSPDGDTFTGTISAGKGCQAERQVTISSSAGTFGTATSDASGAFTVPGNGAFTVPDVYVIKVAQRVIQPTGRGGGKKIKCLATSDSVDLGGGDGGGIGGGGGGI
jgi:hypothetical protein